MAKLTHFTVQVCLVSALCLNCYTALENIKRSLVLYAISSYASKTINLKAYSELLLIGAFLCPTKWPQNASRP